MHIVRSISYYIILFILYHSTVHLNRHLSDAIQVCQRHASWEIAQGCCGGVHNVRPILIPRSGSFRTQSLEFLSADSVRISLKCNPTLGNNSWTANSWHENWV